MSKKRRREPRHPLDSLKNLNIVWVELLETTKRRRKLLVRNEAGNLLFSGAEQETLFKSFGKGQRLQVVIYNPRMKEVFTVQRKEVFITWCCFFHPKCLEEIRITRSLGGKLMGSINQVRTMEPRITLRVRDGKGKKALKLIGPTFRIACCGLFAFEFNILDAKRKVVGKIEEDLSPRFVHALRLSFPKEMDLDLKGVLMGICFMLVGFPIITPEGLLIK